VGVRRPRKRRLPPQVLLDPNPPTPDRQARSVIRRPALADYWAWRQRKVPLPINKTTQELIDAQDGRCSVCGGLLFAVEDRPQNPHEWEQWLTTTRQRSTRSPRGRPARRRRPNPVSYTPNADTATAWHCTTPTSHQGLLEPDAVKAASPVLGGARHSNAPGLPGFTRHEAAVRHADNPAPALSQAISASSYPSER
jgi:hypothetical protein